MLALNGTGFFRPKMLNSGALKSKLPLIVIVAHNSCIVDR